MRHVVFWSGGQDSTLVAVQLLRSGKFVRLVSFDNCWIGGEHQQNLEKMYRKRILQRFESEFGRKLFEHKVYTWDGDLVGSSIQNQIWVSLFPLACEDGDEAYFGNIRTDDFWHVSAEFKATFEQICKFQGNKKVKLNFPIEWYYKKHVIKELHKFGYLDLAIHSGDKL